MEIFVEAGYYGYAYDICSCEENLEEKEAALQCLGFEASFNVPYFRPITSDNFEDLFLVF